MIYLTLRVDMLTWSDSHAFGRFHVCQRRLSGVGVRHPDRDREAIYDASKLHGKRACQAQQQDGRAIGEG